MTAQGLHYAVVQRIKELKMPILTIRNVPDDVHEQLKARAAANRRSVNSEAIECLRIALAGRSERDVGGYLARARMVRERGATYVTDEQIDSARREGRA
jgi:plasmid stability protein